jgi:hypothetical protein
MKCDPCGQEFLQTGALLCVLPCTTGQDRYFALQAVLRERDLQRCIHLAAGGTVPLGTWHWVGRPGPLPGAAACPAALPNSLAAADLMASATQVRGARPAGLARPT